MSNFVPEDILTFDIDARYREVINFYFYSIFIK